MRRQSFRRRQFLVLLALGVLPLFISVAVGLPYSRDFVVRQTMTQLETVADLKTVQVQQWLSQGRGAAQLLSSEPQAKETLETLPPSLTSNVEAQIQAELQPHLVAIAASFPYVRSISVLHPTGGQVLLSTDPTQRGRQRGREAYFRQGRRGLYISPVAYSVGQEAPTLNISAPLLGERERLLAVVVVEMDLADLDTTFESRAGLGRTGRAYLVEADYGFYVTLPPDVEGSPFRTIARSEGVRRVLEGQDGSDTYLDPGGVPVLGVYRRLPDVNLGLLVEIEEAELTDRIIQIWTAIILINVALLVFSTLAARYLAGWLVAPLEQIAQAARSLRAGDLTSRAPGGGPDEIGQLAAAFNQMADSLESHYDNLEQLVAQRTAELAQATREAERARRQAEAANQAKSAFLTNMSHELRTPLSAVLGFTEMMANDPNLTADQRENLEIIGRNGKHLLALINDVLDLSKIEAGKVHLQPEVFDLHEMLLGLGEMFSLRAEQKGLTVVFDFAPDVPRYVRADVGKLRQVLINLLGNAVKFTEQGGVTMRVSRNPEPGSADGAGSTAAALLHVEIKDTGVGIATHELEQVFEAFEQTESGQRSKQGTGLGLPISREYVRMMGGELTVTSQVGVGSCFSFDLPVEVVDAAQVRDARRARQAIGLAAGQPTYKLLVTDDVEASRQLLVKLLDPLGFDVRQAMDGREAIEIWRSWQPDFIFMDMRMPRIDGREATRRIRAFPQGQEVIIVALTAGTFEEEREAILAQGCDDVVLKPFLATTIFSMLERHLGVQFVYREPDGRVGMERAERPTGHPSPDAALDPDWVADMHQATVEGDIQHMERLVAQIRETHPAVAERLTSLARDFAHGEILGLLDRMAS